LENTYSISPQERLAQIITAFTACADQGEPMRGLDYCAKEFQMGPDDDLKGIEILTMIMQARGAAGYETRHVIGYPSLKSATPERIEGMVPVTSYRKMADDTMSLAVADFHVALVPEDGSWKIARLQLKPYIMKGL
jgi:hypothetical protein